MQPREANVPCTSIPDEIGFPYPDVSCSCCRNGLYSLKWGERLWSSGAPFWLQAGKQHVPLRSFTVTSSGAYQPLTNIKISCRSFADFQHKFTCIIAFCATRDLESDSMGAQLGSLPRVGYLDSFGRRSQRSRTIALHGMLQHLGYRRQACCTILGPLQPSCKHEWYN